MHDLNHETDKTRYELRERLLNELYTMRPESYIFTMRGYPTLDDIQRNVDNAKRDQVFAQLMAASNA